MKTEKLWGKRFSKLPSPLAEVFTSGRDVRGVPPADERLIPYDLWGSRAHVVMLNRQNILNRQEARLLIRGLKEIEGAWKKGQFSLDPRKEDVHSNMESWLIEKYGMEIGGKLHTARSRNDQVALDMRLYLRDAVIGFVKEILLLLQHLLTQANKHKTLPFPGYTHHQPAQVTSLGQIWLAFAESFARDLARCQEWYERFNENPLGSMTGYGTAFPIDRALTSKLLGFKAPTPNALEAIQNRWEMEAELAFIINSLMNHGSSLAQTIIIFSTGEFGLFRLDEAYCSGSSMMPQKRNPDPLEIIKAKSALAQGKLISLLAIGRAQFLGYNRDTQWTKYLIMDLIDECHNVPAILKEIVATLKLEEEKISLLTKKGFITAPDLLEAIVHQEKIPFRLAKTLLEKAIRYAEAEGEEQVTYASLKKAFQEEGQHLSFNVDLWQNFQDAHFVISQRKAIGGTSLSALEKNIAHLRQNLRQSTAWLKKKEKQIAAAKELLQQMEAKI